MSNELFLSLPADKIMALTAYGEAASEGAEGMMAVLNVVRNRAQQPNTYADKTILAAQGIWHAVVLKTKQFSAFNVGDPVRPKLEALAQTFDSSIKSNTSLAKAYQLAKMAVAGTLGDNTGGATHYHTSSILPYWAGSLSEIGSIGAHVFYTAKKTITENPGTTALLAVGLGVMMFYLLKNRVI